LVPFAGWEMPVQYPEGLVASHVHTRTKSSLFDVSHMGQLRIHGKDRVELIETITVADMKNCPVGMGLYSLITNPKGGIIDDTIVSNLGDCINMVVNAGCKDKDAAHIHSVFDSFKKNKKDVRLEWLTNSLIALQGPDSEKVLQRFVKDDLSKLSFFYGKNLNIDGANCFAQRSGYTGEDGFEISIPSEKVESISRKLLAQPEVKPCGLGARDTLRLEAGLCLYGNDLDETITPKQASLTWTITERRQKEGGFIGDKFIIPELAIKLNDLSRRRIGFQIASGAPAREHTTIHDPSTGEEIGVVTSGTMSPVLKYPIGMGYVKGKYGKIGGTIKVSIRGKLIEASVVKTPFVPTKYKKN